MRTSPTREESDDLADVTADEHQKATRTGTVKRKRRFGTDCIQTTVGAGGGSAGDGSIPDAFGMGVDPLD
jgi:hypothetical protein